MTRQAGKSTSFDSKNDNFESTTGNEGVQ